MLSERPLKMSAISCILATFCILFLLLGTTGAAQDADPHAFDSLKQFSQSVQRVVMKVSPSIVLIEVMGYGHTGREDEERSDGRMLTRKESTASGVILSSDGYILTNAHVIEGERRIRVIVDERTHSAAPAGRSLRSTSFDARVVGRFQEADLALLKIDADDLTPITLANSESVRPGQLVFAVGSPEGLKNSVSMGIISAISRESGSDGAVAYLQTDAAINAGSSGGALVDSNGLLVGITTFILTEGGGSEGLGFALPSDLIRVVYEQLKQTGDFHFGDIGLRIQAITPTLAAGLHLVQDSGVIASDVKMNSPAEHAGIHVQDIILTVDGNPIPSAPYFTALFYGKHSGDHARVETLRGKQRLMFDVPVEDKAELAEDPLASIDAQALISRLGILCVALDPSKQSATSKSRRAAGVIVSATLAHYDVDLLPGDLIHAVNGIVIYDVQTLRYLVDNLHSGDAVVLQVERKGTFHYVPFEIE